MLLSAAKKTSIFYRVASSEDFKKQKTSFYLKFLSSRMVYIYFQPVFPKGLSVACRLPPVLHAKLDINNIASE
jgi:hypothetical protein